LYAQWNDQAGGVPVLLLHGGYGNSNYFGHLISRLSRSMVSGSSPWTAAVTAAVRTATCCDHSNARLVICPRQPSSHAANPAEFNGAVLDFLARD